MLKLLKIPRTAILSVLFVFLAIIITLHTRTQILNEYLDGLNEIHKGNYQEAIDILQPLGNYKDCDKYIEYATAMELFSNGHYEESIRIFSSLTNFENSQSLLIKATTEIEVEQAKKDSYNNALHYYELEHYREAMNIFNQLDGYENSVQLAEACKKQLNRFANSNTISAGVMISGGVTSTGNVCIAGRFNGDVGEILEWQDIVSISTMGDLVVGLKKDGTVVHAGQTGAYIVDTSMWNDIIAVSAGMFYVVGLKGDGTLVAQGYNGDGQIDFSGWNDIVSISTSWRTTAGLDSNGYIHIAGYGSSSLLQQIYAHLDMWKDIVAISIGGGRNHDEGVHLVGLRKDGTVVAVGANGYHQCDVTGWTDIVSISAGAFHTVGLKSDGTVVTTEADGKNLIREWDNILAVSAGYGFTLGLRADGKVVGAGYYMEGQRNTDEWENIAYFDT